MIRFPHLFFLSARHLSTLAFGVLLAWLFLTTGCPTESTIQDAATEAVPEMASDLRCFTSTPGSPYIKRFDYAGQAANQPKVLRFIVEWSDDQSDLSGGHYQFTLDGQPLLRTPLEGGGQFSQPAGKTEFTLALPEAPYPAKQRLSIELRFYDAQGNASNQPLLVLEVQR